MVQKLKKQSKKFMEEAKTEKQDFQRVRLWLNQISPDNFEKKSGELRELLIGSAKLLSEPGFDPEEAKNLKIDEEKQTIVVETIFRKAQKEHSYISFYAKLCSTIIKLELESKGIKPTPINLKESTFRIKMLAYCKSSFESFFHDPPMVNIDVNDENYEKEIGKTKKLFGNIEFCGDLHRHRILSDQTLWSVFAGLLGLNKEEGPDKSVNDNTVEAALKLITKIGPSIDEKLKGAQFQQKNGEQVAKIYKRFEVLMATDTSNKEQLVVSQRLQFLIRNMFDNKNSGWSKSKNVSTELQTKEQVEEQMLKQAAIAEEQQQKSRDDYRDKGGKYNDKRGGRQE